MTEPTTPPVSAPVPSPLGRPVVWRLVLCAALFALWIGYLALLVFTRAEPPAVGPRLLSRPQAQVSQLDIVGRVDDPAQGVVFVERVLYPAESTQPPPKQLHVPNLSLAGVSAPGTYLLLLTPRDEKTAEVTPLPLSPGLEPGRFNKPRAYLATADMLAQYARVKKPAR